MYLDPAVKETKKILSAYSGSLLSIIYRAAISAVLSSKLSVTLTKIRFEVLLFYLLLYAPLMNQFPLSKGGSVLYNSPLALT